MKQTDTDAPAPRVVKTALLENGSIVPYDLCSRDRRAVKGGGWMFLGRGTIYEINGERKYEQNPLFFWIKK